MSKECGWKGLSNDGLVYTFVYAGARRCKPVSMFNLQAPGVPGLSLRLSPGGFGLLTKNGNEVLQMRVQTFQTVQALLTLGYVEDAEIELYTVFDNMNLKPFSRYHQVVA